MTSDMQEIEDIFRFEAEDLLVSLQEALLEMEGNPNDPLALELQVKRAFRSLHSLKGSAGCIQLDRISHLAHSLENALNILRDASYCYSNIATLINILLQGTDRLQKFIAQPILSDSNAMPVNDIEEQIHSLLNQHSSEVVKKTPPASSEGKPGDIILVTEQDNSLQTTSQDPPEAPTSSVLPSPAANVQKESSSRPLESLRIRVALLDELRRLASELVLVRNQHLASARQFPDFPRVISQRLDALASDLQESIMRMRLQPLSNIFNRFRRVVRDLNVSLGKDIDLDIRGGDVELDNAILDSNGCETYIVDGHITTFPDWEILHNPPSQVNHEGGLLGAVA